MRHFWWGDGTTVHVVALQLRYTTAMTFDEPVDVCLAPALAPDGLVHVPLHALAERLGAPTKLADGELQVAFRSPEGASRPVPERLRRVLDAATEVT